MTNTQKVEGVVVTLAATTNVQDSIMECDYGCLYTKRSVVKIPSAKYSGIPRCIKHGAILSWATWAYGMTIQEARKKRDKRKVERNKDYD